MLAATEAENAQLALELARLEAAESAHAAELATMEEEVCLAPLRVRVISRSSDCCGVLCLLAGGRWRH